MGVPRKHGARDVPGDAHGHLVARSRLSEFRYKCVTVIVPPALYSCLFADLGPRRLERSEGTRGSLGKGLPKANTNHSWPALSETARVPGSVRLERGDSRFVQRDHAP